MGLFGRIGNAFGNFGTNFSNAWESVTSGEWFSDVGDAANDWASGVSSGVSDFWNDITGQTQAGIAEQELDISYNEQYIQALGYLSEYTTGLETLMGSTIPQLQSNIDALTMDIDLWDEDYALQTGQIQSQIDTYDDLLSNWQSTYEEKTTAAEMEGKSQLNSLLSNWSSTEVVASERGAMGSVGLVANQQKRNVIDFAGSDMKLGGENGLYGTSYNNLITALSNQHSQYATQRDLLSSGLDLTTMTMQNELEVMQSQLGVLDNSLATSQGQISSMYGQIQSAYQAALSAAQDAGVDTTTDPAMLEYKKFLEKYKEYAPTV
ncbi:MAG: hypothetical protein JXK93_13490 [Sphaerochaetaceae bacterium]|nr:hypothetical protein [Sphaerochaetaceae bacterium]